MHFLDIVFLVTAIVIVLLSLLQSGKSEGASGAIMGGGINLFTNVKERGIEVILSRITTTLGVVFIVMAMLVNIYVKSGA